MSYVFWEKILQEMLEVFFFFMLQYNGVKITEFSIQIDMYSNLGSVPH